MGFTIDSDTSITVVTPAAESPDTVGVTVASIGGTSAAGNADQFTYTRALYVTLAPASGPPATPVTASRPGFLSGETVKVTYRTGLLSPNPAAVTVCTGIAAADGTFSCNGAIPAAPGAGASGAHKVKAKGAASLVVTSTYFILT